MKVIIVKLLVEDTCNPSDQEAIKYLENIISEVFDREATYKHPRCKLILMETTWDKK